MAFALDISNHREGINIEQLKNEGLVQLYMKATESNNYYDKCLDGFSSECSRLNIPCGYYHFARNSSSAEEQAEYFYNAVKDKKADLLYCLDMETNFDNHSDFARAFISKFEQLIGKTGVCCIYASAYYARDYFDQDIKNRIPLWVAQYGTSQPMETGFRTLSGWQYSEDEYHAGQPCDSNIFYPPVVIQSVNSNPAPQPEPQQPTDYEQHGNADVLVDKLNVRTEPSINSEIVASYRKGQTIYNYDHVYDRDGYRWIRYVGGSGNYRYVAVRVLSTNERYANCY